MIRAKYVKVLDESGKMLGEMPTSRAIELASSKNLDLILINPGSNLCKIYEHGKYVYELKRKEKERARQIRENTVEVKNIIIHVTIDQNDLAQKIKKIYEFIDEGDNVKFSLQLRGREMGNKQMAFDLFNSCLEQLKDKCEYEGKPKLNGKSIDVLLKPRKQ